MTERPRTGGRYVRDKKGKLKQVSKTEPPAPTGASDRPAAEPAEPALEKED